jgi:hypothetical protein
LTPPKSARVYPKPRSAKKIELDSPIISKKVVKKPIPTQVVSESEHSDTDSDSDEIYARTEQHYRPSSSEDDEEVYQGGYNNDFHTQPKFTPQGSYGSESDCEEIEDEELEININKQNDSASESIEIDAPKKQKQSAIKSTSPLQMKWESPKKSPLKLKKETSPVMKAVVS